MSEGEDPFEALRRGNPVPDAKRVEYDFLGHRNHLQQVLVHAEQGRPRPARMVVAAVGVTCLFVLAGAVLVISRDSPSNLTVACYLDGSLDSDVVARYHDGDPLEACRGLLGEGDSPDTSTAVPCRLPSGTVGVFPGPASVCGRLGLQVAEIGGTPAVVVRELTDGLGRAVNLTTCLSPSRANSAISSELLRLGLTEWQVVVDPDPGARAQGCATAAVDERGRRVQIELVPSPLEARPGLAATSDPGI